MWIWDSRTHQFIVSKALEQCNPELVNLILIYQELFTLGIEAPDRTFQDFNNHIWHAKLLYDIKGMLNSKTNYKVIKHPSGTISIRR
ncbi:MAG: hypothetical protein KAT74_07000 [Candidatus Cloacimonetes bacterium]|jgi:hypothetical protein|nr:hypothetical protein [Candidatus Cloacimonadota bacterium]